MPVPMVRKIISRVPRPAPSFHSTSAQAFASFWRNAGTPNFSVSIRASGTFSQPGRLGGQSTTPRRESSGPPQLTPIAFTRSSGV